jgi:DNA helicase-2/ATP-dependent DNA helicase PcrA
MILGKLSDEQKSAVITEGHVLLTACPGSGKTRVLVHKLAYELLRLDEASKKRLVALTFTVRASDEIFKRLGEMGIRSEKIWCGTLHAFCYEWIIKPYSPYLTELKSGFTIADEAHCATLISTLKEKYGLKPIDSVLLRLSRDGSFVEQHETKRKILREYHRMLKLDKLIDFDLLLFLSYKILLQNPNIQKTLSNIFKVICIDEFQDTQDLQYAIISLLINAGEGGTSLFMVGDIDQAIYTSLGGIAKTINEIQSEINNAEITSRTLTGNYRSNQRIIDFYSHFQSERIKIIAKGSNANHQGIISLNKLIRADKVVNEVARLIKLSLDKGIPENEICVLVPQWWLITSITKKLKALLPDANFDASGLAPMSKNKENIWYKVSRLFLTEPNPRLYSLRYRWATELLADFRIHMHGEFQEKYRVERNLLRLINSIVSKETEGVDYLNDCFDQFLQGVGIDIRNYPTLIENRKLFFRNVEKRLTDDEFKIPSDVNSFKSFYREMNGIVINTCIGIKGEEFETVIVFCVLNGFIPHWNEIFAKNAQEASQKLMYVICSRAKTNLHLIAESGRTTKGGSPIVINPELESINFQYDKI